MTATLAERIREQSPNFTKTERRLANFLTANPDRLMLETNSSLADQADVSPMAVSRFVRKIGFRDMADAKRILKAYSYGPPGSEIDSRFERINEARKDEYGDRGAIEAEGVGVHKAYALRRTSLWGKIVRLLAHADSVYIAGFQTTDYLARGMAMLLLYARPDVHYLSGADGVYANVLTDSAKKKTLVVIDVFRYGKNSPELTRFAKERGLDVVVISDEFCEWAAKLTRYHLPATTNTRFFFSAMGSIHVMMNLLVHDVIDELGEQVKTQMDVVWQAQEEFENFL